MCHMSYVMCHVSHVTYHVSRVIFHMDFFLIGEVEGLVSMGPTLSSFVCYLLASSLYDLSVNRPSPSSGPVSKSSLKNVYIGPLLVPVQSLVSLLFLLFIGLLFSILVYLGLFPILL